MSSILRQLIYSQSELLPNGSKDTGIGVDLSDLEPVSDIRLEEDRHTEEEAEGNEDEDGDEDEDEEDQLRSYDYTVEDVQYHKKAYLWMPLPNAAELTFERYWDKELIKQDPQVQVQGREAVMTFGKDRRFLILDPSLPYSMNGTPTRKQIALLKLLVRRLQTAKDKLGLYKALTVLYQSQIFFDEDCYKGSVWLLNCLYEDAKTNSQREEIEQEANAFWDRFLRPHPEAPWLPFYDPWRCRGLAEYLNFYASRGDYQRACDIAGKFMSEPVFYKDSKLLATEAMCHLWHLLSILKRCLQFMDGVSSRRLNPRLDACVVAKFKRNPFCLETLLSEIKPHSEAHWRCKEIRTKLMNAAIALPDDSTLRALLAAIIAGINFKKKRMLATVRHFLQIHAQRYYCCTLAQQYVLKFNRRYFPKESLNSNREYILRWFVQDPGCAEPLDMLIKLYRCGDLTAPSLLCCLTAQIDNGSASNCVTRQIFLWGCLCWLLGPLRTKNAAQALKSHSSVHYLPLHATTKLLCKLWPVVHFDDSKLRHSRQSMEASPTFDILDAYNFKFEDASAGKSEGPLSQQHEPPWTCSLPQRESASNNHPFFGVDFFPSICEVPMELKKLNRLEEWLQNTIIKGHVDLESEYMKSLVIPEEQLENEFEGLEKDDYDDGFNEDIDDENHMDPLSSGQSYAGDQRKDAKVKVKAEEPFDWSQYDGDFALPDTVIHLPKFGFEKLGSRTDMSNVKWLWEAEPVKPHTNVKVEANTRTRLQNQNEKDFQNPEWSQKKQALVLLALKSIVACHLLGDQNLYSTEAVLMICRQSNRPHNSLALETLKRYQYRVWEALHIQYISQENIFMQPSAPRNSKVCHENSNRKRTSERLQRNSSNSKPPKAMKLEVI